MARVRLQAPSRSAHSSSNLTPAVPTISPLCSSPHDPVGSTLAPLLRLPLSKQRVHRPAFPTSTAAPRPPLAPLRPRPRPRRALHPAPPPRRRVKLVPLCQLWPLRRRWRAGRSPRRHREQAARPRRGPHRPRARGRQGRRAAPARLGERPHGRAEQPDQGAPRVRAGCGRGARAGGQAAEPRRGGGGGRRRRREGRRARVEEAGRRRAGGGAVEAGRAQGAWAR